MDPNREESKNDTHTLVMEQSASSLIHTLVNILIRTSKE